MIELLSAIGSDMIRLSIPRQMQHQCCKQLKDPVSVFCDQNCLHLTFMY